MRGLMVVAMAMALAAGARQAAAQQGAPVAGRTYTVGFSQIVEHPAISATRAGLLEGLKAAGFVEGRNLVFKTLNAQGEIADARAIAEKLVAEKVDLMAPCSVPSVLAAIQANKGGKVPVAFGCVTSPVENGVLAALDKPAGGNLTGLYTLPPVARMFDLIRQLRPQARIVGTVYNPDDSTSMAMNGLAKAEAVRRGMTWGEVQVSSPAAVALAAEALVGRVDTFLMLQDSTVAAGFDAVVRVARAAKMGLYSFDTGAVERGAIAAFSQNAHQAGIEWARAIAVPILLGRPAGEIVPVQFTAFDLLLNPTAATAAGITVPETITKSATRVFTN